MNDIPLPLEISLARPEVQEHYRRMIREGQTPAWAEMCALQQPPGANGTDREWMQGRNNGEWLNAMPKRQADFLTKEAKEAGIDISGKFYMSGLADKRGWTDPEAWVSGRDDVLRVAKKRNLNVTGQVNHKAVDAPPPKEVALNDRIVKRIQKKTGQTREQVIEKHAPHWKRGKK